ncbi:cytochrome p450 [Fusarium langsethiae]|uniref:Cytochrome p450 n=1 Tax=Fusarium langsethiae TaxID=179993 RepID=A0A0M9EPV3_FUSLA|nr:cytochrome p450 [Fusarium langsethiae]GKU07521.1 unnamed protein product [Fusarium langsethiae]GKU22856.1 unnamed protein product [Fusarium langsethiae]
MVNLLDQIPDAVVKIPLGVYAAVGFGVSILSCLLLVVYRLFFHPLAGFPGPKLAAATLWYETYYDVWLKGKYVFEIKDMHKKYGPIVRVNPHEIHIDDPEFYHEFYSTSRKLKKYSWYYKVSGVAEVSFGTEDHDVHRRRVGVYKNLFALRSIHQFEPQIKANIDKLGHILKDKAETQGVVNVSHAYRVLTSDTITSYIGLAPSPLLEDENLGEAYRKYARIVTESSVLVRHFPPLTYFRLVPSWIVTRLSSDFGILKKHLETLRVQVELACAQNETREKTAHSTMIHGIVGNERHSSTSINEITEEALILEGAGTDSTAQALEAATFYILNDPHVRARLKEELIKAIPDPQNLPPLPKLKEIKYLAAVVNETLRVCSPASSRFPRVNDYTVTEYKGWKIPPKTPMSMNIWNCHRNEAIFPNPEHFNPERWLSDSAGSLEKYLVPFGSGSRMCIGMNLSVAEQYLVLATLFRQFDFKLFDTHVDDVAMDSSCLITLCKADSKGVQVTVSDLSVE